MATYIETVPNRNSRPAIVLREGRRTRKRTLANLTDWPTAQVEPLRAGLKGDYQLLAPAPGFSIERTRPHGHVAAVLGPLPRVGLEPLLATQPSPQPNAVVAMLTARLLKPRSKLATARELRTATLTSTLGELLNLSEGNEELLYRAMDWLLARQPQIEQALAQRHLKEGTLALYDVSSTYCEGRCCQLARYGYSRDGKGDKLQITFGLLTNADGCPVAVAVFEGHTACAIPCAAKPTSRRGSAACGAATKCASTSSSPSSRAASALREMKQIARAKRRSTASRSCAPACRPPHSAPMRRCVATSACPRSSRPSAA
jgi:hypothetical protein